MKTFRSKLIVSLSFLVLVGCTKLESSSSVGLAIPPAMPMGFKKVGKQSIPVNGQLSHAVLNVSGPNLPRRTLNWDRHESPNATSPTQFEFQDVPNGDGRLFQVLAIYKVENSMAFYYGETTSKVPSDAADGSITVSLSSIGSGPMASGRISGRYLTGTDTGPTAPISVNLYPPGRAEGMLIERSFITNGWFTLLVLDGDSNTKLGYEMPGGQLLWGRPVNLSDVEFAPSDQVVRAAIPTHLRAEGGGGGTTWMAEEANVSAYGFFAPSNASLVSSKLLCRPTSAPSLSKMSVWASPIPGSPPAMPGVIITSGTVALPTLADLTATPNAVGGYRIKGGQPSGCGPDPLNYMDLSSLTSWINGNGGDSMSYVFPPLVAQDSGGSTGSRGPFSVNNSNGTISVSGVMLPGVGTDKFNSIKVYKRVSATASDNWEWHNSGAPCMGMSQGQMGFSPVTTASIPSHGTFNFNFNLTQAEGSLGTAVGVCFEGPANIPDVGFVMNRHQFQNGGGSMGGGGPYIRLEVSDAWGMGGANFLLTKNHCHPAQFGQYQGMGSPYVSGTTAVSITGLPTAGNLVFYSNSTCSGGNEISSTSISGGLTQSGTIYVKATQGTTNHQVTGIGVANSPATFDPATNLLDVGLPKLVLDGPTNVMQGLCYSFTAMAQMANGHMYTQSGSLAASLSLHGTTQLYSNAANCNSTSGNIPLAINPGQNMTSFFGKTTAGTTSNGTFGVTASGYQGNSYSVIVGTTGGTQGRYIRIVPLSPPMLVSKCNAMRVSIVNGSEIEIPADVAMPLKLETSNRVGSFYTDPGCGQFDPNFAIMPGESGKTVWYMPFSTTAPVIAGLPSSLPVSGGSNVSVSTPGGGPYLTFTAPSMGSKVISSYEFATIGSTTFTLGGPGGSTFACSYWTGSMWNTCSGGELSGNTFTWPLAQAVAGTRYRLRNTLSNQSAEVEFDPKRIYGETFEVVNCGSQVTNGSGTVAVQTILANTSPICLGSAVGIDCGSTSGTLGVGTRLIGWSSKNNVTNSTTPATCFVMSGANASGTTTMLANLNMNLSATASGLAAKGLSIVSVTATGSAAIVVANSSITTDAISTSLVYGVWIQNNQPNLKLEIRDSNLLLDRTQTGVNNSIMMTADNRAPLYLEASNIGVVGTNNNPRTAISFNPGGATPGSINFNRSNITGTNLKVLANQFGTLGVVTMTNSQVDVTLSGMPVFDLYGGIGGDHVFNNNIFLYNGNSSLFAFTSFGQTYNLKMSNNKFVHSTTGHLFTMSSSYGGTFPTIEFNRNSFFSSSSTSSGNSRVISATGTDGYNLTTTTGSVTGENLVCESDAGTHGWSGAPINPAPAGGSLTAFPSGTSSATPVSNACP